MSVVQALPKYTHTSTLVPTEVPMPIKLVIGHFITRAAEQASSKIKVNFLNRSSRSKEIMPYVETMSVGDLAPTDRRIFIKFSIRFLVIQKSANCENRLIDDHTLLRRVNEFVTVVPVF